MIISALIYSHTITPRLQYVVDFLSDYYGLSIRLISSEEKYIAASDACKINYSYHRLVKNEIWIYSHVLLFESSVRPVKTDCFVKKGYTAFFKTDDSFGFDLFAAIFFLITRYEEYQPHEKDVYGRYAHINSIAFKEHFLHLPLVNIWLEDFRELLAGKNTDFLENKKRFAFIPTYDIDMAWSYKHKGLVRNAGAMLQLFLAGKWKKLAFRIKVIKGKALDPFDAYEWLDCLHQKYNLQPIYFLLMAIEKGKYDRNINVTNPAFQLLVKSLAEKYVIGLHPSWASGNITGLLVKEKRLLENVTNRPVKNSRQHFIRFNLPSNYQHLIELGFDAEYSMGYGDINGFRASVCTPYYWYDLKKEEMTKLKIYPYCFMDANSYYEQKDSPEKALQELMQLHQVISSLNGTMITIWHNSFLGTDEAFAGWKQVYSQFIAAMEQDN